DDALRDAQPAAVAPVLGDEQHELVAAQARDGGAFADARRTALSDDLEHVVSDVVPQAVVDQLEVVEIDERDAAGAAVAVRDSQPLLQAVAQKVPIGEP